MLILAQNGPQGNPKGHPKSSKISKKHPQNLLSDGLETQSGKSRLAELPPDLPMCLPYSKYHGSSTFHKVPAGSIFPSFWLHFGSLLDTLGGQKHPENEKAAFKKNAKK